MSDSDDLLGKADAFLKRYHPSPAAASDDIPVLTEVVPVSAGKPTRETAAEKVHDGGPSTLREIEQSLTQRVLEAMQPQIAKFFEESLRARLEDHLRRSLATLTGQVRADVEAMVRDAVTKAVQSAVSEARKPPRGNPL